MENLNNFKTWLHINESSTNDIKSYIEDNSNFTLHSDDNIEILSFSSRENGNVGNDEYSDIDLKEARDLVAKMRSIFKDYDFSIETVDEWVHINVKNMNFFNDYEPEENNVGYVLSCIRPDGRAHKYETNSSLNTYSGREKHREEFKRLVKRFILDKTPQEVLDMVDSLRIEREYAYSDKVLIQKAHGLDSEESNGTKWETIPNADFYVSRREIW